MIGAHSAETNTPKGKAVIAEIPYRIIDTATTERQSLQHWELTLSFHQ